MNWLLARSHAEEIRLGTRDPFTLVVDRAFADGNTKAVSRYDAMIQEAQSQK